MVSYLGESNKMIKIEMTESEFEVFVDLVKGGDDEPIVLPDTALEGYRKAHASLVRKIRMLTGQVPAAASSVSRWRPATRATAPGIASMHVDDNDAWLTLYSGVRITLSNGIDPHELRGMLVMAGVHTIRKISESEPVPFNVYLKENRDYSVVAFMKAYTQGHEDR